MQHSPQEARRVLQQTVEQFERAAAKARAEGFPIKARTLDDQAETYRKKLTALTAPSDKFSPSETPNGF